MKTLKNQILKLIFRRRRNRARAVRELSELGGERVKQTKPLNVIISCILIGLATQLFSQSDTLSNDVFGGFLIFPIEFPVIDNSQLDLELNALGYSSSDYPKANLGIGFQLYYNRWIPTFSFNKTTKRTENGFYYSDVEYRSTSFNVGFDLTKNHRYSIYPYLGFKGYGLKYMYRSMTSTSSVNFSNYLSTSRDYKEFYNTRGNLDLGIGFSYQWFFLVNFRAGYLIPLENSSWKETGNNTQLIGAPMIGYNYYFTITFGLGGVYSEDELRRHYNID